MTQDLNRRKDDRHPDQPLQWDDKPDLLAMRAGVNEIQREIERARSAGLTMLALPVETANAACCYVAHLGERLAESVGAAPAEQASKQVPSRITDTTSARKFVDAWHRKHFPTDRTFSRYIMAQGDRSNPLAADFAWQLAKALESLDAQFAAQPAAPVAATKQAIPEGYALVPLEPTVEQLRAEPGFEASGCQMGAIYRAMIAAAPLATPADAGAGLTDCDAAFDNWYAAQSHQLTNEQVCRLIWQRGWQACARLSTPAAPVTELRTALNWLLVSAKNIIERKPVRDLDEVFAHCETLLGQSPAPVTAEPVAWMHDDGKQCTNAASKAWMEMAGFGHWAEIAKRYTTPLYATPVSPQPAAQVPSRERDAMREAWQVLLDAGVCPGLAPMSLADGIRAALKGQPAAAHAAHDQKGGGNAGD